MTIRCLTVTGGGSGIGDCSRLRVL